jgi:hypothetical protein
MVPVLVGSKCSVFIFLFQLTYAWIEIPFKTLKKNMGDSPFHFPFLFLLLFFFSLKAIFRCNLFIKFIGYLLVLVAVYSTFTAPERSGSRLC